jgi:D-sedoheptulose 7-phosphate isomerase
MEFMTHGDSIQNDLNEHLKTIELVRETLVQPIHSLGKLLSKTLLDGGTVFWCGNGGSASDSQHLSAELVGRFKKNRRPLRSVALTTDTSALTCIANDFSYDDVFSRQVEALGRPGDLLVCISTSGKSENILRALKSATKMGMKTCALLGKGGGTAKELADHSITIPSDTTARIQEAHILIGHILCELIERELGFA